MPTFSTFPVSEHLAFDDLVLTMFRRCMRLKNMENVRPVAKPAKAAITVFQDPGKSLKVHFALSHRRSGPPTFAGQFAFCDGTTLNICSFTAFVTFMESTPFCTPNSDFAGLYHTFKDTVISVTLVALFAFPRDSTDVENIALKDLPLDKIKPLIETTTRVYIEATFSPSSDNNRVVPSFPPPSHSASRGGNMIHAETHTNSYAGPLHGYQSVAIAFLPAFTGSYSPPFEGYSYRIPYKTQAHASSTTQFNTYPAEYLTYQPSPQPYWPSDGSVTHNPATFGFPSQSASINNSNG
ncbi:hypothetical protein C8R47DRAFT_1075219 [Mycena vitilis]|nr:hypothetical protein C8R47DRAFT_1075219 [Mycena vitilis]